MRSINQIGLSQADRDLRNPPHAERGGVLAAQPSVVDDARGLLGAAARRAEALHPDVGALAPLRLPAWSGAVSPCSLQVALT